MQNNPVGIRHLSEERVMQSVFTVVAVCDLNFPKSLTSAQLQKCLCFGVLNSAL